MRDEFFFIIIRMSLNGKTILVRKVIKITLMRRNNTPEEKKNRCS